MNRIEDTAIEEGTLGISVLGVKDGMPCSVNDLNPVFEHDRRSGCGPISGEMKNACVIELDRVRQ